MPRPVVLLPSRGRLDAAGLLEQLADRAPKYAALALDRRQIVAGLERREALLDFAVNGETPDFGLGEDHAAVNQDVELARAARFYRNAFAEA